MGVVEVGIEAGEVEAECEDVVASGAQREADTRQRERETRWTMSDHHPNPSLVSRRNQMHQLQMWTTTRTLKLSSPPPTPMLHCCNHTPSHKISPEKSGRCITRQISKSNARNQSPWKMGPRSLTRYVICSFEAICRTLAIPLVLQVLLRGHSAHTNTFRLTMPQTRNKTVSKMLMRSGLPTLKLTSQIQTKTS